MKKVLILFLGLFLVSLTTSFSQSLMDYVKEVKGDTLVVNDYYDMGGSTDNSASSLTHVIVADSVNVPAGRVYELQTNGWYPLLTSINTPSNRPVTIVGADNTILVNNADAGSFLPLISGYNGESTTNTGGLTYQNDFTMKNVATCVGAPDGNMGWAFYGPGAPNTHATFQNCLMEHNRWVMLQSNAWAGSTIRFIDDYFVNMSGQACRRNGGVYDNVNNPTDTMWVENCTHIMAQGSMYKFRDYEVGLVFINHNTFINCAGSLFETRGFQSKVAITNNIFVNSNVQPFRPNMTEDLSEQDNDQKPTGIIDVAVLPDSMPQLERKFYVDRNVVYWDSRLLGLGAAANAIPVNGFTTWEDQSVKMNTRTKSFFDDNTTYPYLYEGIWYDKVPAFADAQNLLTTQVDLVRTFALATVDTTSTAVLPNWRLNSVDWVYPDWPIPVDLSYTDTDLLTGATDNLPVGDLNWFPTEKATFNANKASFDSEILRRLENGTDVQVIGSGIPTNYTLAQNYPNPFNPTTSITFTLPQSGNVTLKVYDIMGKEVATLVNGFHAAQTYKVDFDGASLASGVYLYTIRTDNFTQTKKMVLMK